MTKQFKTNFKSFCEFTSLHGWHYMVDSECGRSNFKKIFWGFIVIFSMATASFFLYANTWVSFLTIINVLLFFIFKIHQFKILSSVRKCQKSYEVYKQREYFDRNTLGTFLCLNQTLVGLGS